MSPLPSVWLSQRCSGRSARAPVSRLPQHRPLRPQDFPQRIGVALVGVGIVGSSIAWYYSNLLWTFGILFATAWSTFCSTRWWATR